jgi:DeoR family transcriptional regulator of aga operon
VVADSSKIGKRGFAKICEVAAVSDLITDAGADPADLAELRRRGPRVHVAPTTGG